MCTCGFYIRTKRVPRTHVVVNNGEEGEIAHSLPNHETSFYDLQPVAATSPASEQNNTPPSHDAAG